MILAGGLLVSLAALLVLRWPAAPGTRQDGGGAAVGDAVVARPGEGSAAGGGKARERSPREARPADPALRQALGALAAAAEEDLAKELKRVAAAWPEEGLAATIAELFATESAEPSAGLLRDALLRRWTLIDPAAAAAWAATLAEGPGRLAAVEQVALAWAAGDSGAAWDWAAGLAAGPAREAALLSLAYELSRDDPALALERSSALPDSPGRAQFIEHAIANLATRDPRAALLQADAIDDPVLRGNALARLATSWAESDPSAAATLAVDAMAPGPAQERAIAAVVQRWAQQDPAAVRAWVATFPDGPVKDNALGHISEQTAPPPAAGEEP
jgi:hypothetical protein